MKGKIGVSFSNAVRMSSLALLIGFLSMEVAFAEQLNSCHLTYTSGEKEGASEKSNAFDLECGKDNEEISKKEQLADVKKKLRVKHEAKAYTIEKYAVNELVVGKKGNYYKVSLKAVVPKQRMIDLTNAATKQVLHFEPGQYVIEDYAEKYTAALNYFASDILEIIDNQCKYGLYVKGGADKPDYVGEFHQKYVFNNIGYLEKIGSDSYSGITSHNISGDTYRNADLPNLRAAFLSRIFYETYGDFIDDRPMILQGEVTSRLDVSDRNAEIFLFVDFESC